VLIKLLTKDKLKKEQGKLISDFGKTRISLDIPYDDTSD